MIYYAAAKLGFKPPPAGPSLTNQEPEEYLNGQLGGHLQWVQTFAGPNSSVAVVINGQTYEVNKALRSATTIDSNGDGLPNYMDPNPFNTPPPGSVPMLMLNVSMVTKGQNKGQKMPLNGGVGQAPASGLAISWLGVANTAYTVQSTTNLASPNWQPLLSWTNNTSTNQAVTVFDTNAPAISSKRFYRISSP